MKQPLLLFTCFAFFILTVACEKAEKIHLLSAHTWVVAPNSPTGLAGDEYRFHDNRLFFKTSGGFSSDGKWDFGDDLYQIIIDSDLGSTEYRINKLTAAELEFTSISVGIGTNSTFVLAPKK